MKLWHVVQWGNSNEGVNGWDTQCIVSAIDMQSAIKEATIHFDNHNSCGKEKDWINYYLGKASVVYLMGQDDKPDGKALLIVRVWVAFGDNMGGNPSWHYKHGEDVWLTSKEMFGED